jgi:hypothetical protein
MKGREQGCISGSIWEDCREAGEEKSDGEWMMLKHNASV